MKDNWFSAIFWHPHPVDLLVIAGKTIVLTGALVAPGKDSGKPWDGIGELPPGRYRLEWVDPVRGTIASARTLRWSGGDLTLSTPPYTLDVALRMRARGRRSR